MAPKGLWAGAVTLQFLGMRPNCVGTTLCLVSMQSGWPLPSCVRPV